MAMQLRPYQKQLVIKLSLAWRAGRKAPCIVLPCGGGKSCIIAEIVRLATLNGKFVLFIVHRRELCDQIIRTLEEWGCDMDKCLVMMVQTACRRIKKLPSPSLIVTDENHHSKANSYRKIYDAFPDAYRVGVTATPVRLDGSGLADVNDELIVGVSAKWLIENEYLAPYDYYAPTLVDLTGIKIKKGDYDTAEVENMMIKKAIFGDVIQYYKKFACGMQAVCYCTSIRHSQAMAQQFCDAGIEAVHIDGQTPKAERDSIIEKFRRGAIDILCNVDLISEGFDVPDCSAVILLRPTQSLTLYIQQSMRCMRYKKGKRAVIIDHVGNYARFGMPDDDREWTLEGRKKQHKSEDDDKKINLKTCPECFGVFMPKKFNKLICPHCGYEFPESSKNAKEIETEDVELQKIEDFEIKNWRECTTYAELQRFAKSRGYKNGWCYYKAKELGIW